MLKLACKYMRYYKSQTFALLSSVILTAALLSGVSSLLYSSRLGELKNNKTMYGDWHYRVEEARELTDTLERERKTKEGDFKLESWGRLEVRDVISAPYQICFLYGDETLRRLMHREITEGTYPERGNEIAADRYTLGNLGFTGNVGDTVAIGGRDYLLTGLVKSRWAAASDEMELFVGKEYEGQTLESYCYLKFDEDEKLYRQMDAFQREYHISGDMVKANDEVTMYLEGEKPERIRDIIKFALTDERGNFTYIVLKLQSEYNLAYRGMVSLLCVFSLFVIYSIFSISVSKRTAEYGVMQTLGISDRHIAGTLAAELWILLFSGYPIGCALGNGLFKLTAQRGKEASGLYMAWDAVLAGFVFLLAALAAVGFFTVHSLRKQTARETMLGDTSFAKRRRKIRRFAYVSLADVTVRRFFFANKRKAAGILLSLSLGGCLFLCTTYMVENLKIHAEMTLKSDDGLGSVYRISLKSNILSDMIPEPVMDEIRSMPGLEQVYGVKYTLGELRIREEELEWEAYFDEKNEDSYFQQNYGGVCVKKEDGDYGIKYDVYGYDKQMIDELQEFVLEGELSRGMLKENEIIAVANKDGQGNYMFYGKHPGDTVLLRVPKNLSCDPEVLKFQSGEENYVEKEFKIAAIVSRALAKEDQYLNVGGWKDGASLILSNEQMERQYGIRGYGIAGAAPESGADTDALSGQLLDIIKDVPRAVLKDYGTEIDTRKAYLVRQQMFFTGIAAILLVISLFHIINSMNHSILSRRREYGIMRAMGITESGFMGMILRAGLLYGLLADILIFLIYQLILRKVMDYYMMHVVQFLHLTAGVPAGVMGAVMGLNLLITVFAVSLPAGKILRSELYACL